jgi:Raf kinase inhibitor-like YbhB/YbcL family protein
MGVTAAPPRRESGQVRAVTILAGALILAACGGSEVMSIPEPAVAESIVVTSPAFADGQPVPREYTCKGAGRAPELGWRGIPAGANSLALVVSDPDAPKGTFVHWVLYALPARDGGLPRGDLPPAARQADNSAGKNGWYPPCPPSGTHRYRFTVYALGGPVTARSTQDILDEIGRLAVARGTLTGTVAAG